MVVLATSHTTIKGGPKEAQGHPSSSLIVMDCGESGADYTAGSGNKRRANTPHALRYSLPMTTFKQVQEYTAPQPAFDLERDAGVGWNDGEECAGFAAARSAIKRFEKKEGRFFEERKNSQTVSFREHARAPSHAHHAQSHETL